MSIPRSLKSARSGAAHRQRPDPTVTPERSSCVRQTRSLKEDGSARRDAATGLAALHAGTPLWQDARTRVEEKGVVTSYGRQVLLEADRSAAAGEGRAGRVWLESEGMRGVLVPPQAATRERGSYPDEEDQGGRDELEQEN
jgi:hypothetical protein